MCEQCEQLAMESMKMRRIPTEEAQANPHVFKDRLEERIKELLDKYGYEFRVFAFTWQGGIVQAQIDLLEKQKENIEVK